MHRLFPETQSPPPKKSSFFFQGRGIMTLMTLCCCCCCCCRRRFRILYNVAAAVLLIAFISRGKNGFLLLLITLFFEGRTRAAKNVLSGKRAFVPKHPFFPRPSTCVPFFKAEAEGGGGGAFWPLGPKTKKRRRDIYVSAPPARR